MAKRERERLVQRECVDTPVRSKVNMSPSHLAALLGVLGSELQLDKRRLFLLGELGSSTESKSERERQRENETTRIMRVRKCQMGQTGGNRARETALGRNSTKLHLHLSVLFVFFCCTLRHK